MSTNRVSAVEANLDAWLAAAAPATRRLAQGEPLRPGTRLDARRALALFEDQATSRALDVEARELKRRGTGYYTISSAGHEQNAVVGALLRPDDPCFLHYRSGAFVMARSRQVPGETPVFDTLLSLCAAADDPASGGRHKVWGSRRLWIPPQTSTIASHLPKATGMAFALSRARRLGLRTGLPADAIVCCSFGDASINHATALAGINSARYSLRRGNPMPILFLCEDNGIGISFDTPRTWVTDTFGRFSDMPYFEAKGEVDEIWEVARSAIDTCRGTRRPVLLHLRTVRLWGHAGSDIETTYRTLEEILEIEAHDPLLQNAKRLVETGAATPEELLALRRDVRARVQAAAAEVETRPHLASRAAVVRPLVVLDEEAVRAEAARALPPAAREAAWGDDLPERRRSAGRRTLAAHVNAALHDELLRTPEALVFGEDVGKKGGVYGLTAGLQKRFGVTRAFDTLLDETTILGLAQGAAHVGFLPIAEIQYLAYLHNAIDQLRGEASSLAFFSDEQFTNPLVLRVAGLAYQRGFGGHFHNDNSIGALREIPGLRIAVPSRGDDAARLLRGCTALARAAGKVVAFLEPIALYHERDLYEPDDGLWCSDYPPPPEALLPGEVGLYGPEDAELLVVSYANGLRMSLRAARSLEQERGARVRVLDLRWLAPLPFAAVRAEAERCGRVLVVDECRATGAGVADALLANLAESDFAGRLRSLRAADSFVPLGPATEHVLVTEEQILGALREVLA